MSRIINDPDLVERMIAQRCDYVNGITLVGDSAILLSMKVKSHASDPHPYPQLIFALIVSASWFSPCLQKPTQSIAS